MIGNSDARATNTGLIEPESRARTKMGVSYLIILVDASMQFGVIAIRSTMEPVTNISQCSIFLAPRIILAQIAAPLPERRIKPRFGISDDGQEQRRFRVVVQEMLGFSVRSFDDCCFCDVFTPLVAVANLVPFTGAIGILEPRAPNASVNTR